MPPDLPFARPDIGVKEIAGVVECLQSGWLTSGEKVRQFEVAFATSIGAPHAISCTSATMAALLLFEAFELTDRRSEVVFPTWTFSGPAMMAHKLGATVVLADVDPYTFNLTAGQLEPHITPNTRMVVPTHFAGVSCDIDGLLQLCDSFDTGIEVIDDAAHAFPSWDARGRKVGDQGAKATFFSFYATKTLTTGDGGMIVTENADLARDLRAARSHGMNRDMADRYTNLATGWRYDIASEGWKGSMNDIAAAIGLAQLSRASMLALSRRTIAATYDGLLRPAVAEGLIVLPPYEHVAWANAWHLYPVRVMGDRDRFIAEMGRRGVQCSMHFIPLHHHSFWKLHAKNGRDAFPNADRLAREEVSLPIFSKMSRSEIVRVAETALEVLRTC